MDPVHSFGGSALDRHLIDFETAEAPPAGGDMGGAAEAAPTDSSLAPADPAADAEAPPVEEQPAPWMPPDTPEAREWIDREFDARLNQWTQQWNVDPTATDPGWQQQQQPAAAGNPFAEPLGDPLEDGFGDKLDARFMALAEFVQQGLKQVAQQAQQPFQEMQFRQQVAEGDARVKDVLSDLAARDGDFDTQAAERLWAFFAEPHVARYGTDGRAGAHAAELGIRDAAQFVRSIEKAAYDRGRDGYKNEMDTLTGARGEPGAGSFGGASGAQGLPEANSLSEVTKRFAAQAHALRNGS